MELGKPSEHNIKSVLKSLSIRSIEHRRYVAKTQDNRPWIKHDVLNRCTYTENNNEPYVVTDCLVMGEKGIELATELFKQPRIEHSMSNKKKYQMHMMYILIVWIVCTWMQINTIPT